MRQNATVKNVELDRETREIKVLISAKGSQYIQEPNGFGSVMLLNSAPLVEGFNYVLEFGHEAINEMKGNNDFAKLVQENRILRRNILNSDLAARVRQFLSSLNYEKLTDFQAKCALLLEKELYTPKIETT